MNDWLLKLTDEEISQGVAAAYDAQVLRELKLAQSSLLALVMDSVMLAQAEMIMSHRFDRGAAQVSWESLQQ
jgi:hypothetical protein